MSAPGKPGVSPARREAFRILLEIERKEAHSDDLLRSKRVDALSETDRGLCTALVLGVLRWQIRLDATVRPLLARPNAKLDAEIRIALRMGAFQLLFLDRVPAHAAIGESVALCKAAGHRFASGMVNAVLRKVAAMPKLSTLEPPESADAETLATAAGHPAWMVERWMRFYGAEAAREICLHGQEQPALAVRVVDDAATKEIRFETGALLSVARTVAEGDFSQVALIDATARIQDEGSQLIGELAAAAAGAPARILDCCAAPGGKTLILAERWPQAEVMALELHPERCEALRRRMLAAAEAAPEMYGRIVVRHDDAARLASRKETEDLIGGFDLILADVPCSGTGTLGRNPEIRHRVAADDLTRHHERQCAILSSVLRYANQAAAPGKQVRVVYSTCSLEPEENQDVVAEVLGRIEGWRQVSLAGPMARLNASGRLTDMAREGLEHSLTAEGAMMLLPGMQIPGSNTKLKTDGFFAALIERVV